MPLAYNLNFFKSKLKPNVKIMLMVKAFGYGMADEIAKLLSTIK
jgi:alanine racemase